MPDKEVRTNRELIYYQYAKIIAKRALSSVSANVAKRSHYGFIKKTFRELRDGTKSWSEITREDWQLAAHKQDTHTKIANRRYESQLLQRH